MFQWIRSLLTATRPIGDQALMLRACLRALNMVYFALMLLGLPATLWFHLIVEFKFQGLLFLAAALCYVPTALGRFPRAPVTRLYVALVMAIFLALGINSLWDWEIQPGLYLLVIPMITAYIGLGPKKFGLYWLGVAACLVLTSTFLGSAYPSRASNMFVTMGTWAAVSIAGVSLFHFLITALLERTHRLEQTAAELATSESHARQLNASMARMFGVISHELRTPASSISMLANDGKGDAGVVEEIQSVADHLLHVIDDLRMAVTPDANIEIDLKPVTLGELMAGVERQLRPVANRSGITLRISATNEGLRLITDQYRVRTVVSNLVRNALLHSEAEHVLVVLASEPDDDGQLWLRMAVEDDGRGVAEEERDKIFELFSRGSTRAGGTGIGLFLASQWAESLGGRVSLAAVSQLGGARFTVDIPVAPASGIQAVGEHSDPLKRARQWARGRSVLVVEDEPLIRRMTERLLETQFQMAPYGVADSVEAVQVMEIRDFDCIVTDYFMPKMDGTELIKLLRDGGCKLPIIAVTAATIGDEQAELLAAGANHVISKPLTPEKFELALAAAILDT